jgi:PTS system nitrogen regulatory IIA component
MLNGDGGSAAAPAGIDAQADVGWIFHRVPGTTREAVLEEIAVRLAERGLVPDARDLWERLLDRERLGCTGLGRGVAIPHCKLRNLPRIVTAVATTEVPVDFGAADGIPIDLIFLVASPAEAPGAHLQTLARISRVLRTPGVPEALRSAASAERMADILRSAAPAVPVAP